MALPRVVSMRLILKNLQADGNTMLVFEPRIGVNEGKGPAGLSGLSFAHYGALHVLVNAACAADFVIGNNYTWTAT